MTELIDFEGVSKFFRTGDGVLEVLKDVNWKISSGQKISIIGPSGVGKSTLLNLLGLITRPTSGSIIISNKNTIQMKNKELALLRNKFFGYITQDYSLVENETVFENVKIPLLYREDRIKGKRERRYMVSRILEQLSINEKIDVKANLLSGGQRQRVAIARAMINDPEILLCDEPTGALDSETGEEIFSLLESVCKENNKTLILVTHNTDLAIRCDIQLQISDKQIIPVTDCR